MEIETKSVKARVARTVVARVSALMILVPAALFSACGSEAPAGPSEAIAESDTEALLATTDCTALEDQLRFAQRQVARLLDEIENLPPGPDYDQLIEELRAQLRLWVARAAQLRAQLDRCRNPPPPPPDPVQCPNGSICCAPVTGGCASLGDCAPVGGSCN